MKTSSVVTSILMSVVFLIVSFWSLYSAKKELSQRELRASAYVFEVRELPYSRGEFLAKLLDQPDCSMGVMFKDETSTTHIISRRKSNQIQMAENIGNNRVDANIVIHEGHDLKGVCSQEGSMLEVAYTRGHPEDAIAVERSQGDTRLWFLLTAIMVYCTFLQLRVYVKKRGLD